MPQSVTGVWSNLYAVCQTLYASTVDTAGHPVLVNFGDPGAYQPDIIVAVMGGTVPVTRPTMGAGRSREEPVAVDVIISAYVPGTEPSQLAAFITAQTMADQLKTYLRTSPNETLSGACRDSWVSNSVIALANIRDETSGNQTGSVAEITVTVTAAVRT